MHFYLYNPELVQEIVDKLPHQTKIDWARFSEDQHTTLITLSDWLIKLSRSLNIIVPLRHRIIPPTENQNLQRVDMWVFMVVINHQTQAWKNQNVKSAQKDANTLENAKYSKSWPLTNGGSPFTGTWRYAEDAYTHMEENAKPQRSAEWKDVLSNIIPCSIAIRNIR